MHIIKSLIDFVFPAKLKLSVVRPIYKKVKKLICLSTGHCCLFASIVLKNGLSDNSYKYPEVIYTVKYFEKFSVRI